MARGGNPTSKLTAIDDVSDAARMTNNTPKTKTKKTKYTPDQAKALIDAARAYAVLTHATCPEAQTGANDHGGRPYWMHCDETVEVEERFGGKDPEVIAACWNHDNPEDCYLELPREERLARLEEATSPRTARIVESVTDVESIPDPTAEDPEHTRAPKNRKERKAFTLPLTLAQAEGPDVKLDDRIANAEFGLRCDPADTRNRSLLKMYTKEQPGFEEALRTPDKCEAKWKHLRSVLLMSDAPAGEGEWKPAGRLHWFEAKELNTLKRSCEKGECDELFMPARDVIYARVGDTIFECSVHSDGKMHKKASRRTSVEEAKIEFARLLPSKVSRWFRPIEIDHTDPVTVDELIESTGPKIALDRCLQLIHVGRSVDDSGPERITFSDRDRDGIREGVRRWARQHPELVDAHKVSDVVHSILTGYKRNATTRPMRSNGT